MKDIKDYEGLYAVTSCGKVWSYRSNRFLKPLPNSRGYFQVELTKDGKRKKYYIHRLVAEAYIPNPEGLPQVNHKDENKQHNYINNLEWCSAKENTNYGTRTARVVEKNKKPVYCVELDRVFASGKEASAELGVWQGGIAKACNGKQKTAGGYHWRYADYNNKDNSK